MQVRDPCMTANVLIVPLCETVRLSVYLASAEDAHSTVSHACVACQAASFVPLLVQETEVAFKIRYVPFNKINVCVQQRRCIDSTTATCINNGPSCPSLLINYWYPGLLWLWMLRRAWLLVIWHVANVEVMIKIHNDTSHFPDNQFFPLVI